MALATERCVVLCTLDVLPAFQPAYRFLWYADGPFCPFSEEHTFTALLTTQASGVLPVLDMLPVCKCCIEHCSLQLLCIFLQDASRQCCSEQGTHPCLVFWDCCITCHYSLNHVHCCTGEWFCPRCQEDAGQDDDLELSSFPSTSFTRQEDIYRSLAAALGVYLCPACNLAVCYQPLSVQDLCFTLLYPKVQCFWQY